MARDKYDALEIANYFLYKRHGRLTPMQVIKLVYFAHGWTLKLTSGKPLINENVEAWRWGPVVRSVYNAYKHHGEDFIRGANPKKYKSIDRHKNILDRVLELYGQKSGLELSALTHKEGTPWHTVFVKQRRNGGSASIPDHLIKEYFDGVLLKKESDNES
ncbi:MAG: DUF4065 domain-containing protein [Candidatus Hatepunaea meridiana]|nr:DUF4065 domain-containing protein [Candidatus Hatepunaea meridiana]